MSFHLLNIPSISIVTKLTIHNIGDKQQNTNIVDNNIITIYKNIWYIRSMYIINIYVEGYMCKYVQI